MSVKSKVLLINLDDSQQRLNHCSNELQKQNITFERISAIRGSQLTEDEILQHYSPTLNSERYFKSLSVGEIGCYLSHRKAWQKIVDEQLDYGIVLEDDISLDGDLKGAIESIDGLGFNWDYIKLSRYENKIGKVVKQFPLGAFELVVYAKAMTGCGSQAVSYEGAKKLLKNSEQFGRPVDSDIQHWWECQLEVLNLHPFPLRPNGQFESDIRRNNKDQKRPEVNRLKRTQNQVRKFLKNSKERKAFIKRMEKKISGES